MHTLHRFLVDYDMAMLRALSHSRGIPLTTNRQTEAVDELAAALADPQSVRAAVARLSPSGREGLDSLLAAGGQMRAAQFSRRYGQVRPTGPGRLEREAPWRQPVNPAEELYYLALVFRAFDRDEAGPGEFVFIPQDLRPHLPQPEAAAAALAVETVPAPPVLHEGGAALVQDLFAYLVYIQNHEVRPYADGRLGSRDAAALSRRLVDAGERRFAFVRHLAARLGLVTRHEGTARLNSSAAKRWLTASATARLAVLQQAWRDDVTWNDLLLVPGLSFDREESLPQRNDPVATRKAVLAMLARCPAGSWWSPSSFVAAVKRADPDFQRPDGDYSSWYVREEATGEYLSGFESWERVEGRLLADLLTGALFWLGVVRTGIGEAGVVCRLAEAGFRLLGLAPAADEPAPTSPIVVDPNLVIHVPAPENLYTRFQLERFSHLESTVPCRYRLTVGSLGRALARGLRAEQVLAFLHQASASPVPGNVAAQIHLWAGRFDSARLEEVAVLRVRSERVLKELALLPETRPLLGRTLSPTTALVRQKDLPHLKRVLSQMGYLRSQEEEPPQA